MTFWVKYSVKFKIFKLLLNLTFSFPGIELSYGNAQRTLYHPVIMGEVPEARQIVYAGFCSDGLGFQHLFPPYLPPIVLPYKYPTGSSVATSSPLSKCSLSLCLSFSWFTRSLSVFLFTHTIWDHETSLRLKVK